MYNTHIAFLAPSFISSSLSPRHMRSSPFGNHTHSRSNLPIHILTPPISLRCPTLLRSAHVSHLIFHPPVSLVSRLTLLIRHSPHPPLTQTLPIPNILRRLLAPLSLLCRFGFGLGVDRSLGGTELAAGFGVGDCVGVFGFVPAGGEWVVSGTDGEGRGERRRLVAVG